MNKSYLALISIFTVFTSFSQQTTIAKFVITDSKINGIDVTEAYVDAGGYIAFYTSGDENLYMTNIMSKRNTQSYGRLYSTQHKSLNETYQTYKADIFYFRWHYINSYDTKTGTATVKLIKIYKPQGVTFECFIVAENLDVMVYKGFMEGTVDLSQYSN
jgi:hypothetical protein